MIDAYLYNRKRRGDRREWIMNLIFGAAFWGGLGGSLAERLGYLQGGLFRILFASLLVIVIAAICLMTAFLAFIGYKHLKSNWNNRPELIKAGGAISAALKRMNLWSYAGFAVIIASSVYVGLPLLGLLLVGGVIVMMAGVVIIGQIGNMRASKL